MLFFSMEKKPEFPFLVFPYFRVMPFPAALLQHRESLFRQSAAVSQDGLEENHARVMVVVLPWFNRRPPTPT